MNAAARLVHQKTLTRSLVYFNLLSKRKLAIALLVIGTLFSGFGMIYFTHYQRLMYANYQQLLKEKNQLQIKQGELLLERSTWLVQSRIQSKAEKQLDMVIPETQSIVFVQE